MLRRQYWLEPITLSVSLVEKFFWEADARLVAPKSHNGWTDPAELGEALDGKTQLLRLLKLFSSGKGSRTNPICFILVSGIVVENEGAVSVID